MNWYPSKVDVLIAVAIGAMVVAVLGAWISVWQSVDGAGLWETALTTVAVAGILVGLVFPMRYGIGSDWLVVRFGLCRLRIRLADIASVEPTRNPLASPALSLQRLYLVYGPGLAGNVMISPADKDAFLDELAAKAGLLRSGDRLSRAAGTPAASGT